MITASLRPAIALIALFTLLTGLALPVVWTGLATAILPDSANGSLMRVAGRPVGSALIGQDFEAPRYFHGRPSATTDTDANGKTVSRPYDANSSGGSNLAPTSKALIDRVRASVKDAGGPGVPADMVTTSASGLDPDISPADADRQVARVAAARHVAPDAVRATVRSATVFPSLGFVGETRVNVLRLNLALDARH